MRGNPEFIRNLWTEISFHRAVVMPAVTGMLFLLIWLINGQQTGAATAQAAALMFCAIAFVWGTRVASESVVQEINGRTWDTQRMSAIGPWTMAWGKLFGATVYIWYGALICLGLYWMSYVDVIPADRIVKLIGVYVLCAVIAHATGLLVSMQAIQKRRDFGRVQIAFYQFLGLAAAVPGLYIGLSGIADDGIYRVLLFYDRVYPLIDFMLVALAVFAAWALVGIWRLMRAELQMENGPWVWLGFVLFATGVAAGIRLLPPEVSAGMPAISSKAYHGFSMLLILTYMIALSEPKGPVLFRRLRRYVELSDWAGLVNAVPRIVPTLLLLALATVGLLRLSDARVQVLEWPVNFHLATVATFLLVLRDVGFIYLLNIARHSPRNDMTAFVYITLAWTVVPVTLSAMGLEPLTALFWPKWDSGAALTIGAPLAQVVVVYVLFWRVWLHKVASRR
ncbi:MAG: hypothetical protein GEU92_10305 [Alphaproteobacteria bacterium]|nr:hypothetical protein [Alphaproteobacteria bacterium]